MTTCKLADGMESKINYQQVSVLINADNRGNTKAEWLPAQKKHQSNHRGEFQISGKFLKIMSRYGRPKNVQPQIQKRKYSRCLTSHSDAFSVPHVSKVSCYEKQSQTSFLI